MPLINPRCMIILVEFDDLLNHQAYACFKVLAIPVVHQVHALNPIGASQFMYFSRFSICTSISLSVQPCGCTSACLSDMLTLCVSLMACMYPILMHLFTSSTEKITQETQERWQKVKQSFIWP